MNTIQKWILGIFAVLCVVNTGFALHGSKTLGDATVSNFPTWYYNGIVIGASNSLLTNLIRGTCTVATATSTSVGKSENMTCAVSSTTKTTDQTYVTWPAAGITSSSGGFAIVDSSITSPGTLSLDVTNVSLATATPPTAVNYLIVR